MAKHKISAAERIHRNLKRGGHLEGVQNGKKVKLTTGKKGGYAVGAKHGPEGGIKGRVGTDKQPIEFEGSEIVITAPASSDPTLHEFEGKQMTKRQILSAINVDAGGVSFAKGGQMPKKIKVRCRGKQYKYGGKMMSDYDIVNDCGCQHSKMEKGGVVEQKLLDDLAKVELAPGYKYYEGHPKELLHYIQDQATGMDYSRKYIHTGGVAFKSLVKMVGSKDLVLRCVAALPQEDKDRVIAAWKGKALDPELRRALRKKTMAEGGEVSSGYDVTDSILREFEIKKHQAATYGGSKWVNRIPKKVTEDQLSFIPASGISCERVSCPIIYGFRHELSNDQRRIIVRGLVDGQLKVVEMFRPSRYVLLHTSDATPILHKMAEGGEMSMPAERKTLDIKIPDTPNATNSTQYQHYKNGGRLKPYPTMENDLPPVINEKGGEVDLPRASKKGIREIELKLTTRKDFPDIVFTNSHNLYEYLMSIWDKNTLNIQESFYVLYLNRAAALIGYQELSKGGITGTVADPELIVATASKAIAKWVVIAHNHPSGNLKPSNADEQMTQKIKQALTYIDCKLMDHIIVTPEEGKYYSFADEGALYEKGGVFAKGGPTGKADEEKLQFIRNIKIITPFVPEMQIKYLTHVFAGEERSHAVQVAARLADIVTKMPHTYQTEDQKANDKIVYLHYFYAGSDWYIVEKDMGDKEDPVPGVQHQAFGYAILNGDMQNAEWGYISIEEIKSIRKIELDFYFTPKPFGELPFNKEKEERKPAKENKGPYIDPEYPQEYKSYYIVSNPDQGGLPYIVVNREGVKLHKAESVDEAIGWVDDRLGSPTEDQKLFKMLQKYKDKSVTVQLSQYAQKIYADNEKNNNHIENLVLIAKATENVDLIQVAEFLQEHTNQAGYFPGELNELRNKLSDIIKIEGKGRSGPVQTGLTTAEVLSAPQTKQSATTSTKQHADINRQVRALIDKNGDDRSKYSAEELALLRLYEGAGAEKKTSSDVRILDQFFTPMDIISKMWGMCMKHGFSFPGSKILEPSVGSGRFLSFIPAGEGGFAYIRAYDVDKTCATICKLLYPSFDIRHGSFEQEFFKGRRHVGLAGVDTEFDLVIGNPPYREYVSEYAPLGEKEATGATTFEMYFIDRGVDVLKKNGLLCFIIPNTFMSNDNKYNAFKERLAKKCDLVDAYRLPNKIFGSTDVGTDILLLRKK